MKKVYLLIFIFCVYLLPRMSQAVDVYKVFNAERFDMFLDTKYMKTNSNYDSKGDKQNLLTDSEFQDTNVQFSARFSVSDDKGIYGGINYSAVESRGFINTGSNSLFNYYILGLDYQFIQKDRLSLYFDFSYWLSNENINVNSNDAITSNGASEFKYVLVGVADLGSFKNFAKIGYSERAKGLSSLVLYGLGAEYLTGNVKFGAMANGYSSVKDDENTNTPQNRDLLTDRVNAGSRKYYAINPNLLELEFYGSYAVIPNLVLKLSAGSTVLGVNAAEGYFGGLSVNWGFGGANNRNYGDSSKNRNRKGQEKNTDPNAKQNQEPKFEVDTNDGVNQEIFDSVTPPKKDKKKAR